MENNESEHDQMNNKSESFSYSWYPTQCEISTASTSTSTRSLSYRIMQTDGDEELVVVEQKAVDQPSQCSPQSIINIGNKFTDQQVKVLMKAWKELYDKRQHIRTCESDWHDITDKVNMAPGSAKTVKQVKKKFKNLRDRYRASKIKNKKRNFGFSKSLSFTQFEMVYGEIDNQNERPRQKNNVVLSAAQNQGVTTSSSTCRSYGSYSEQNDTSKAAASVQAYKSKTSNNLTQLEHGHNFLHTSLSSPMLATSSDNNALQGEFRRVSVAKNLPLKPNRSLMSQEVNGYQHGTINTSPRVVNSNGGHPLSSRDGGQPESGLVNAVRELQQQQITMQREIVRSIKQMEERIVHEISTRTRESEERFRQQIANALTQLGNLIRIT